jgi:hypothetical protein
VTIWHTESSPKILLKKMMQDAQNSRLDDSFELGPANESVTAFDSYRVFASFNCGLVSSAADSSRQFVQTFRLIMQFLRAP